MAERALPTNRRTNCKMFLVPILFLWPHHTTALRKMIAPLPTANASVCLVQFPWRSFNSPLLPRSGLVQSKFTTLGNPETYLWPKFARAFAPVTTTVVCAGEHPLQDRGARRQSDGREARSDRRQPDCRDLHAGQIEPADTDPRPAASETTAQGRGMDRRLSPMGMWKIAVVEKIGCRFSSRPTVQTRTSRSRSRSSPHGRSRTSGN